MGHRHLFNTSQMFESEQDQNWNHMHIEQTYANSARVGPAENGPFYYPAENMPVDGVHFTSQWNPSPMSNAYISSSHNVEVSHYQPDVSGPSRDPFLHSSTAGTFCTVPENHARFASSSNYERQTFHGVEAGLVDLTMGNVRGPHKRKSPGVPSACEGGSASRYYGAGSSSDPPLSSELQQEKPNLDPQYMAWECFTMTPGHRGNLSIRPEGAIRNVRSRPALDPDSNLARTHLSSSSSHTSYPAGHSFDHSNSMDFSGQSSSALSHDWSHARMPPASGRMLVSDASGYNSHDTNHFLVGSSITNAAVDIRGYPHDFISSRNPVVPQSFHSPSAHSIRGIRSSSSQRPSPAFRASSSTLRLGHVAPSDDGMQLVAETSRQPRLSSAIAWRNSDRNGRSRVSYDRYRSVSNEPGLHDRFASEGYMVVDRSTSYGPRNMVDQHRDMRLDVDNMSYEELLALGERIGCVSTGLSEDLISKCLTETVYCSSGLSQDEGNCVICLEEYKDMDDVGSLKACGHDYHVSCIKKWLSMKNLCPICKASAMADNMKE
ncbi:E3 ubiquitin-protein ligase MBR1 [Ricinus communis]|uniref:E3 ubiquitin-protein ligase MBR1 n=1 Tax=Ricinus communis TaxID=3988 RepID=UPI00201AC328|nr:E3 ubiquitin-protein ligase MBR1 [Ricinus communis]XP_015574850.2 E3 ubiquitin-protein ligase MBR1 [Ricinus communis]XP_015574852.2 E3 ubiquitin-protein ligase MBR1 [Ricinus communis]XP_048236008.1 E3 ubiquitin-protein ligase MBR1 [Ricinus communis]XP_048236009.1 E3 ubiquitin-protein ligase MBR1 [Ricinus communis]